MVAFYFYIIVGGALLTGAALLADIIEYILGR